MNANDYEVAVIGGGPCGLLTALLLARRGVRCAVFERKTELLPHPKAMALSRRTAEILQQTGLREVMRQTDVRPPEYDLALWAESLAGEIYGRVAWHEDDPAIAPYAGFHCPQTTTERVLLEALEREGAASIFFDHDVMSIAEQADAVRLAVHRGRHDQTLEITSRYLVAADGAGSPTRHRLGIAAVGPGDQGHFLNTFFRAPYGARLAGRRAAMSNALRKNLFEVFVAVDGHDLWLMHHFLQPGETPADYPPEKLEAVVREASGFPELPVEILGVNPWVMSPKVAAQFRQGRVLLTGDAAARLSPVGGLGLNTGLQSAHNLAWKLAAVLRGAPEKLLDSYDAERRGQVMRTFGASNDFSSEVWPVVNAGVTGDLARVRALAGSSRRGGGGLGLDLGWRYEQGAFLGGAGAAAPEGLDAYVPTAEPGRRAPHLWLEREGARLSMLDLFGASFVLLVSGEATPWRAVAEVTETFAGFDLEIFQIEGDDGYGDPDGRFAALYGLAPGEAVLVRPDGVVGWRSESAGPAGLRGALESILAGG